MVLEIAQFEITPGLEEAFEAGVKQAVPLFQRAKGFSDLELGREGEPLPPVRPMGDAGEPHG